MGQEQPSPEHSDQPDLDRTQPSPSRPPRRLDWRPPDYRTVGEAPQEEVPPVRRVQRPTPRRRRPPTEGAPPWVVGLGVGALLAVIGILVVAFVFSRRSAQSEPTPTMVVVTPTVTLLPRPTGTIPPAATATSETPATEETSSTAAPSDAIRVGGYVRVAAPAGLSFRENPGVNGALIQVLDSGITLAVIGGPEEADGYTWWQLRMTEGNVEGWSAAGDGEDIFLEPAPAP